MITMISITWKIIQEGSDVEKHIFHLIRHIPYVKSTTCVPSIVFAENDKLSPIYITLKNIWISHSNQQCL
jgi:hypothetical protein